MRPPDAGSLRPADVLGAALANIANASNARVLDEPACRELLAEVGWGMLAVVDIMGTSVARPYTVPSGYAYLDDTIYFASGEGRKQRAIERHPSVCLTITDVETFHRWRSVVVSGRAVPITTAAGRAFAIQAFVKQRRPGNRQLTASDGSRLLSARIYRIEVDEMQGRAAELGPSVSEDEHAARTTDALKLLLRSSAATAMSDPDAARPGSAYQRLLAGLDALTPRQRRLLGDGLEALLEASGIEPLASPETGGTGRSR